MTSKKIEIQWVHSWIGAPEDQRATVRGLGLRRLHQKKTLVDTPAVRGMINKVCHMVKITKTKAKEKAGT